MVPAVMKVRSLSYFAANINSPVENSSSDEFGDYYNRDDDDYDDTEGGDEENTLSNKRYVW